jgi:hypothetical protein
MQGKETVGVLPLCCDNLYERFDSETQPCARIHLVGLRHSLVSYLLDTTLGPTATGLSVWKEEERKLVQPGVYCVLKLGARNIEKSGADFGRKAYQNSKNKAVPR